MKIAFYHATLPGGHTGKEGGVSYAVHRLANTLVGRGHHLTVFSFDPVPSDALYHHRQLPLALLGKPLLGRLAVTPLLLSGLDLHGFDVMHAHGDDHLVMHHAVPWVRTMYGSARREFQSAVRLRRRLSQMALVVAEGASARAADVTVGISRDTAICLPEVEEVIPVGVDLERFRPPASPRSPDPSLLFVGTLRGRKRGDLLLRLFSHHIRPRLPTAQLWMVAEAGTVAMDGLRYYGQVDTDHLIRLYQQAWVFCLPSSYEGFGVPYIEALACGAPIVATPNPGAREILDHGRYGVLAPDGHLPDALLALLGDDERRRGLGEAGLARATQYSWESIAARYEEVYERALRRSRR